MSNSVNLSLIENNFDLLRNFTKDTVLFTDVNHQLYPWGIYSKMFYVPMRLEDIDWTIHQVKNLEQLAVDRTDPKNADLLTLIGKIQNLECLFKHGIERVAEAMPAEKEKITALIKEHYPEVFNPMFPVQAPPPPQLPVPGAKQQQAPVWARIDGKKVLTIKENTPRPPANLMEELLTRLKQGIALNVSEFEKNLKAPRKSNEFGWADKILEFQATVAGSDDEGEASEITSAWQ